MTPQATGPEPAWLDRTTLLAQLLGSPLEDEDTDAQEAGQSDHGLGMI